MLAPNSKMQIGRLLMIQTNTYNDQVIRPMQTNMTGDHLALFKEATQYGENITAANLTGIAGSFLRPQAEAAGAIQMYNGWDLARARFLLTVIIPMGDGGFIQQHVAGYTDHYGVTADGHSIDPNMRMFFNSTMTVNVNAVAQPGMGMTNNYRVADVSQLLAPPPGYSDGSSLGTYTMRPEDIINSISTADAMDGTRRDLRTNFAISPIKKSSRENVVAADYLAKTMTAVNSVFQRDSSLDHNVLYSEARGLVRENLVNTDPFIGVLQSRTRFRENGYITYSELCALFPETEHVREQVITGNVQQTSMPSRGQSEHWHVPTNETVAATILAQTIPALMMELMLSKLSFIATNDNIGGLPSVTIMDHRCFADGINAQPNCVQFMERFKNEIMNDISHNNMINVYLAVSCTVVGDTLISISLNGGPKIDYVVPSFCDSMFSPMITTDQMTLHTIANDIDTLNNNLVATVFENRVVGNIPMVSNPFGYLPTALNANHAPQQQGDINVGSALVSSL